MKSSDMVVGERYNWRNQAARLIYLGYNWSGNGFWHQFERVGEPGKVWCEVPDSDLHFFEKTPPDESAGTNESGLRLVSITVGGSTHTRTADNWLELARKDLFGDTLRHKTNCDNNAWVQLQGADAWVCQACGLPKKDHIN